MDLGAMVAPGPGRALVEAVAGRLVAAVVSAGPSAGCPDSSHGVGLVVGDGAGGVS